MLPSNFSIWNILLLDYLTTLDLQDIKYSLLAEMHIGQSGLGAGCGGQCGHARHAGHAGQAGHGGSRVLYFWRRQPPQCAHSEPADQLGSLGGRGVLSSSFSPFSRASPVCPGKGKSVLKLLP